MDRRKFPYAFRFRRRIIFTIVTGFAPAFLNEQIDHFNDRFRIFKIFIYGNPAVGAQIGLCCRRLARCGRKRICGPLTVGIIILRRLERGEGKPLLSKGKSALSGGCSFPGLRRILYAEFRIYVTFFIHFMKRCQSRFALRLDGAVNKLSVFFHPNTRICAVSIKETSQAAETASKKGGSRNTDTYGILLSVTVEICIDELVNHVHHLIHGGRNFQIQFFQPVGTDPHEIHGVNAAAGNREAILHAVFVPCKERGIPFLIHHFFGEIGCILFKNRTHFLHKACIDKLHHLCGGDTHNIGKVFARHRYIHFLVKFIVTFYNPVVYDFDTQFFLVGIQPEIFLQGLAGKVGKNVGFDSVIGGTDEMDFQRIGIFAEWIRLRCCVGGFGSCRCGTFSGCGVGICICCRGFRRIV